MKSKARPSCLKKSSKKLLIPSVFAVEKPGESKVFWLPRAGRLFFKKVTAFCSP
jgi:hypothetical protein